MIFFMAAFEHARTRSQRSLLATAEIVHAAGRGAVGRGPTAPYEGFEDDVRFLRDAIYHWTPSSCPFEAAIRSLVEIALVVGEEAVDRCQEDKTRAPK